MTNSRLYIASKNVSGGVAGGEEHLYLIYDPNIDGDGNASTFNVNDSATIPIVVRGGPQSGAASGNIAIGHL